MLLPLTKEAKTGEVMLKEESLPTKDAALFGNTDKKTEVEIGRTELELKFTADMRPVVTLVDMEKPENGTELLQGLIPGHKDTEACQQCGFRHGENAKMTQWLEALECS